MTMMTVDLHRVRFCHYMYEVIQFADSVDKSLCHQRFVLMLRKFSYIEVK